jgi:hypothetical protein
VTATLLISAIVAVCVFSVTLVAVGVVRLRTLTHRVGWFECGMRRLTHIEAAELAAAVLAPPHPGAAALSAAVPGASHPVPTRGIAHYAVGRIDWWPRWSVSMRPAVSWSRADFTVLVRIPADDGSGRIGLAVVHSAARGVDCELTMSDAAYAGLASWLEAAPPGPLTVTV